MISLNLVSQSITIQAPVSVEVNAKGSLKLTGAKIQIGDGPR
jgi:hypothetical protein